MDKTRILLLCMAHLLWERYCKVGLHVALLGAGSPNGRADDMHEALANTALATYRQFCQRHGINTGLPK